MGVNPGGCVGVRRVSDGIGGGGPFGGGVCDGSPAYGLVTYEVSEFMEGIGSRRAAMPDRLLFSPFPCPLREGVPGDRCVSPFFAFGESAFVGGLPESRERGLI